MTGETVQEVSIGIDLGTKHTEQQTSENKVLAKGEVEVRQDENCQIQGVLTEEVDVLVKHVIGNHVLTTVQEKMVGYHQAYKVDQTTPFVGQIGLYHLCHIRL